MLICRLPDTLENHETFSEVIYPNKLFQVYNTLLKGKVVTDLLLPKSVLNLDHCCPAPVVLASPRRLMDQQLKAVSA